MLPLLNTLDERIEHLEMLAETLSEFEVAQQRILLQMLIDRLAQDTSRKRYRIVRELVEILTTEVFTSVAVLDYLWGIGWIHPEDQLLSEIPELQNVLTSLWGVGLVHKSVEDMRQSIGEFWLAQSRAVPARNEDLPLSIRQLPFPAVFLSFTGGLSQQTLLLVLMQKWLLDKGCLGVVSRSRDARQGGATEPIPVRSGSTAPPIPLVSAQDKAEPTANQALPETKLDLTDICDTDLLNTEERQELWSLVAWRREAPDPLLLLQTAAQRLIHPEIEVQWDHYQNMGGGFNTLFSQPGATAALGGMVQVHYPGVTIYMPMTEDGDAVAIAAKARLALLLRLFLPVCLRADVVWKEAVARMGQGSYLRHPYQTGVRIAK